jgi:hypothetical protein
VILASQNGPEFDVGTKLGATPVTDVVYAPELVPYRMTFSLAGPRQSNVNDVCPVMV